MKKSPDKGGTVTEETHPNQGQEDGSMGDENDDLAVQEPGTSEMGGGDERVHDEPHDSTAEEVGDPGREA